MCGTSLLDGLPEDAHPLLRKAWPGMVARFRWQMLGLRILRLEAELSLLREIHGLGPDPQIWRG